MDHGSRLTKLIARLVAEDVDALVVTKPANIRYLCGFTGSTGVLVVTWSGSVLLTDGRYQIQASREVTAADVTIHGTLDAFYDDLSHFVAHHGARRVAYESQQVTVGARSSTLEPPVGLPHLARGLEGMELVPSEGWVEKLREVKDADEAAVLRKAAAIADDAFSYILERVEVGRTEVEIALDLEMFMRNQGAEALSFPSIVASGENSALPHARASRAQVEKGKILLLDFGCVFEGYCSDLTRTVVVGPADDRHREVYEVVAASQAAALSALKAGVRGIDVDRAAREVISAAGWPEAFNHGLGHAVGMEVHEDVPRLSKTSEHVVEVGNVLTIEPGAYFEGWGGVRIEDLVWVTGSGIDILSAAPKDLIVL